MKLEDAARALREEGGRTSASAGETRARIVADLEKRGRRRARRPYWIAPVAAVLAAATASGAVQIGWSRAFRAIAVASRGPIVVTRVPETNVVSPGPLASSEPAVELPPTLSALPSTRGIVPVPHPAPRAMPTSHALPALSALPPLPAESAVPAVPALSAASAAPLEPPLKPDTLALYRAAHRQHFGARDPAAALSAWNDYLRADPYGAFALEARYNRAVCLVRLGRFVEAREALAMLVDEVSGGYRANDARALLDAIDSGALGYKRQIE